MRLGEVDGPDAEVVLGVDETLGGGGLGLFEQAVRGVPAVARGLDDPLGGAQHGVRVLEPGLAGVQLLGGVDGDEPTGGVQDVGDRAHAGVGVPDGVAEHRADALLGGEADGTGGQAQRAGSGALAAVPHGFEAQRVAVDLPPGREQPRGPVGAPGGERAADVGGGAEQYGQALGVVVGPGEQRLPLPVCDAVTILQRSAQPAAPSRARKVTRGVDSSMKAPPRTGARRLPPCSRSPPKPP